MQSNISKKPITIGHPPFSREEMISALDEFSKVYANRPVDDNHGGMKAPQAFHAWFVAKKLNPELIIESGVWYGQGTWFFEQACPEAKIICIDPDQSRFKYVSKKAVYTTHDFNVIPWDQVDADKEKTLCFFDDHQNALSRLPVLKTYGFKHFMFEDNYPVGQGDCESLKTTLEVGGEEADFVREHISHYMELPPPVKLDKTRWGDDWGTYPIPAPLITEDDTDSCYYEGADNYTWICYGRMK